MGLVHICDSQAGHNISCCEKIKHGLVPLLLQSPDMVGRRLFFDDLSDSEDDSHQGSSSKRGVDHNVDIVATIR